MLLRGSLVTQAIQDHLAGCTTARGYVSNVGATVRAGYLRGMAEEAPSCWIMPGRHAAGESHYAQVKAVQRMYEIRGVVSSDDHDGRLAHELVDLVIWDIRRCVEGERGSLFDIIESVRYQGDNPQYREDGGVTVGAAVQYLVSYSVDVMRPDGLIQ